MNIVRCPACRKMYEFSGLPPKYCPECYLKDEKYYQIVRDLVKEHPGINIITAAELSGVPQSRIMRYVREERLEAVPSSTVFLNCVSCGKIINTGLYCAECKHRQAETAKMTAVVSDEPAPSHMHGRHRDYDREVYNTENAETNTASQEDTPSAADADPENN